MAKTIGSDSNYANLSLGNGSSIITPSFPLLELGKFSWVSDFAINAPTVNIDPEIKMLVERESEKLRSKTLNYTSTDEKYWQLDYIIQKADIGIRDNAKSKLTRDGKNAVIAEVGKAINASSLDHSSKYLLSNEPLFVYALSYAIYYEKVNDSEGINDRVIVATENKIKAYFNKLIAEKIIRDRHIDLTETQKEKILQAAETTNISYLKGEPVKSINKIIAKFVDYGTLHDLVDLFFTSGKIDPKKGTPQVRQAMVNYLIDIGLVVKPEDLNPKDTADTYSESSSKAAKSK